MSHLSEGLGLKSSGLKCPMRTNQLSTLDFSTMNFSTPDFSTPRLGLKNPGLESSWLKSPGLKGLGLKLGVEKSGNVMSFNHLEVEQVEHIVDAPFLLLMTLTNLSIHISFFLPIQILPYRFSLALQDFSTILPNPLLMSYFYYRNPNLWNFVMKKIFRGSSVQPVPHNEIQLQNI